MKQPQKISVNQFADTYRNEYSGWDHMSDIELAEFVSKKNPNVRNIIDFTQAEPSKEFKETYDPGVWDHMKQSWFNLKSMGIEIPSFAIAQAVRFVDDEPEMKKKVVGWAEDARGWGKNKVDEWIKEDKGVQGYLEWQSDVPMGLNNFYHGDMMARGLANLAPSIATMIGTSAVSGGALGVLGAGAKVLKVGKAATQLLTGFALEGSSEYNEAMGYLVDDPEGPQLDPSEAIDTANSTALAYGLVSGAIEAFQIGKVTKVLGMGDEPFKKIWTKRIANTLQKAKEKGNVRTIAELGGNVLKDSFIQGFQEGSQQTSQILVGNIYRKYGGDPDKAFQNFNADLQEAIGSPEVKESFFSAASANLLMGGTAGSARFAGRRALKRIKDREETRQLEEDTHEFPEGVIGEARSEGAISGMALMQNIQVTNPTAEEKDQMDNLFVGEDSVTIEENKTNFFTALQNNPAILNEINPNLTPDEWFNLLDPNNENNNSVATVEQAEAVRQAAINLRKPSPAKVKKVKKKKVTPKKVTTDTFDQQVSNWATSFEQEMERPPTDKEIDNYKALITPDPDISESTQVAEEVALKTYPNLNKEELNKELKKIDAELANNKNTEANEVRKGILKSIIKSKGDTKTKTKTAPEVKDDKPWVDIKWTEKDKDKIAKQRFNIGFTNEVLSNQQVKNTLNQIDSENYKFVVLSKRDAKSPQYKPFLDRLSKLGYKRDESGLFTKEGVSAKELLYNEIYGKKDPLSIVKQKGVITDQDKFSKEIDKIIDPNNEMQTSFDIDYQRPQQSPKAKDNKELSNAMEKRLKKQFPWIKATWIEKVLDSEGLEVSGRAFKNIVEWSKGKATLDTIPHEYAHIYIKLMKGHPVIQEGLKRFKGEENLVQHIGEYYTNRMANKSLHARFKTWLRKFHIALKQFFGFTLSDKQLSDAIGEKFFGAKIKDAPKKISRKVEYQKSLQERMTKKIESAISPGAKAAGYLPKEQVKTERATQFIGAGSPKSSSDRYRKMYEGEGLANTGDYKETDVIFIASNGNRGIRVNPVKDGVLQGVYKNVDLAMEAGATIMMDNLPHLVRTAQRYNWGERDLAIYIKGKGYRRLGETGEWIPAKGKERKPTSTTPAGIQIYRRAFRDLDYSKLKNIIKNTGNKYYGWISAWYGGVSYTYGPGKGVTHKAQDMPGEFRAIANKIEDATGVPRGYYNSALVNLFPKGKGITAHADDEIIFQRVNGTIGKVATVSLGGSTEVTISKGADEKIKVNAGDVYIMPGQKFQLNHKHAVGPSNQERISLTFRHVPVIERNIAKENELIARNIDGLFKRLSQEDFNSEIAKKIEKFGERFEDAFREWAVNKKGKEDIVAKIDSKEPKPQNVDNNPIPADSNEATDGEVLNHEENVHPTNENEQIIVNSDVRESVDQVISQALKVIGAGLLENSSVLRSLVTDAKSMDFDTWLNTSLKARTGKDLSNLDKKYAKSEKDAKRQLLKLWVSVNSQGKVNSKSWFNEIYHNMHLIIKQAWDGKTFDKGRRSTKPSIVKLKRIEGVQEKWFGGENSKKSKAKQFITKYISHNVPAVANLFKNSYLISGENFYQSEESQASDTDDAITTNPSKPYGFLGKKEMSALLEYEARRYENGVANGRNPEPRRVPVITRGEGESLLLGEITSAIRDNAKNHIAYWKKQKDAGFITKDQFDAFVAMKPQVKELGNSDWGLINIENEIATYEFLNTIYPGYLKDKSGWANILKRIKIPLTPANSSSRMGDANAYFVLSENLGYSVPGSNEIIPGRQTITDVAKKGNEKHIGDGNIPTSASYFKRLSDALGLDPFAGFAKTIIYDSKLGDTFDESSTLMIKAQQHRADEGITYYDNGVPFAIVDKNGNIVKLNEEGVPDYAAQVIDMIMTQDERKIGKGVDYGKKSGRFTIKGESIGLIKYPEKSKTKTKFPHQWLNYLPAEMQNKITNHYMKPGSSIRKLINNVYKNSSDAESIKKLVKAVEKMYPGETPGVINNFVDLGSGKHPASATQLAKIIVSKYLIPAMSMDGQRGTTSYLAPNYYNDLSTSETAMSVYNAKPIISEYNKEKGTKLKAENIDKDTLNEINEWLKGRNTKVLVTRSPVPHLNGVVYLRVKRLHLKKDVVEFHKDITFRLLEGDYDGDSVAIEFPDPEIAVEYEKFFNSKLYSESIEGVDLGEYKKAKNVDMTNFRQRFEIMEEMGVGQRAISQVATTQAIFNSIRKTINMVVVENNSGKEWIITPNEGDIQLGNIPGEKGIMSVDRVLRRYLQAATDNAKFLLLNTWEYDITNLRQRLFILSTSDGESLTFADRLKERKESLKEQEDILQDKNLPYKERMKISAKVKSIRTEIGQINAVWSRFEANIWNLHKTPYSMRKGNDGANGKLLLEDYIKLSREYSNYLKDRNTHVKNRQFSPAVENSLPDYKVEKYRDNKYNLGIVDVKSKNHQTPVEYLSTKIIEEESNYKSLPGQTSPIEFDNETVYSVHNIAHKKINDDIEQNVMPNLTEQDSEIKAKKYGSDLVQKVFVAVGKNSRIQPQSWMQNEDLVKVVETFTKRFNELTDSEKKIATSQYIEKLVKSQAQGYGRQKQSKYPKESNEAFEKRIESENSTLKRLETFAPTAKETGFNLLDSSIVSSYFKEFNDALEIKEDTTLNKEGERMAEIGKNCR